MEPQKKKYSFPFITQEIANPRPCAFSADRADRGLPLTRQQSGTCSRAGRGGSSVISSSSIHPSRESTEHCWFGCGRPRARGGGGRRHPNQESVRPEARAVTKRLFGRPCLAFPHPLAGESLAHGCGQARCSSALFADMPRKLLWSAAASMPKLAADAAAVSQNVLKFEGAAGRWVSFMEEENFGC